MNPSPRQLIVFCLPLVVIAGTAACGGSAASSHGAADSAGAGGAGAGGTGAGGVAAGGVAASGGAATTNTGGAGGVGAASTAGGSGGVVGVAGALSANAGAGGSAGTGVVGSTCGAVPLPMVKPLAEPAVNADPTATLMNIVVSGPASTYASEGTPGTVGNISASLRDQGVYTDGTVRSIENLTADINYKTTIVWTSSDPTIAAVMSGDTRTDGGIQGFRAGTVTITVALGSMSQSVCFVVTPPVVRLLAITGPDSTASNYGAPIVEKQGATVPLTCTETLTDGTTRDVTKEVTWASSDTAVATVSTAGAAPGLAGGTTVITAKLPASVATAGPSSATASVTLDVIGATGLQQGVSCQASPQTCAAGLSCCSDGRLSTTSSCSATLSLQSPCPMYP